MKKNACYLCLLVLLLLAGCGKQTAIEYNDALVDATKACLTAEVQVWESLAQSDIPSSSDALQTAKSTCEASHATVSDLGDFDGDGKLGETVENVLSVELQYLSVLEEVLSYSTDTPWTDAQQEEYLDLQEQLAALRAQAIELSEQVVTLQEEFAQQHDFVIEESVISNGTEEALVGDGEGTAEEEAFIEG